MKERGMSQEQLNHYRYRKNEEGKNAVGCETIINQPEVGEGGEEEGGEE